VERVVRWPEVAAMVRGVEELGFDSVWTGEHLLYRDRPGTAGPWEAWTILAAVAAITERIRLGPLVAALPFHNPAVLAKQAATVQEISGGRLVLPVGAGWNRDEFEAFGLPFERRVDRFADQLGVMVRLLAGEEVTHSSEFVELDRCRILPPAAHGSPPLVIGSNGDRMLSIALPVVTGWNSWFSGFGNRASGLAPLLARVDAACEAAGRDPSEIERSVALLLRFDPGPDSPRGPHPIHGPAEEMAAAIAEVRDAGIDEVQFVLDPITVESIESAAAVMELVRADGPGQSR
jgi:probable F420-dependent oxidoreductase